MEKTIGTNPVGIKNLLISIDQQFIRLQDETPTTPFPITFNKVVSLIHHLIEAIIIAKKEGMDNQEIRSYLPTTWEIHGSSSFIKHVQTWPKGFPGDCKAINMIIDRVENQPLDHLGGMIGRYALNTLVAQQHREKIKKQAEIIKEVCRKFKSPSIVSIACGSSRDIEMVQDDIKRSGAKITLIDFDEEALEESATRLESIQEVIDISLTNVRNLPKLVSELKEKNGKFHLVYAGGLFDYLPYGIIKLILIRLAGDFMNKDGILMFTNIASNNLFHSFRPWLEVMANWELIDRTEEEMEKLLALTGCERKEITLDPTGLTWIAKATF